MQPHSSRIRSWAIGALSLLAVPAILSAQAMDGGITGTVTDASGAGVGGAAVKLTNNGTGVAWQATTAPAGSYRFQNIPAGQYRLNVEAQGFQPTSVQNAAVNVNQVLTLNVTMAVASVNTTVEVVEATAQIDTTTANVT
ncbi:MAG: carboxypeptidase-like regulatory domain-containing protein, partial [Bryobacteraceae bacterium]|nr:carboxypeptidase-like regulatory domain-containing protein [Bryobacteraceae bacterium]